MVELCGYSAFYASFVFLQKFSEKNTVGDNDSGAISVAPFDNKIFKCKFVYKYQKEKVS